VLCLVWSRQVAEPTHTLLLLCALQTASSVQQACCSTWTQQREQCASAGWWVGNWCLACWVNSVPTAVAVIHALLLLPRRLWTSLNTCGQVRATPQSESLLAPSALQADAAPCFACRT
jgi:hypothetical protein